MTREQIESEIASLEAEIEKRQEGNQGSRWQLDHRSLHVRVFGNPREIKQTRRPEGTTSGIDISELACDFTCNPATQVTGPPPSTYAVKRLPRASPSRRSMKPPSDLGASSCLTE